MPRLHQRNKHYVARSKLLVARNLLRWCKRGTKVKVKRTCIAPFVKLQLNALRYGSHRFAPANYTISAFTLRTFARWRHLNGSI